MLCQTVKTGLECAFMSKKGCGFFGNSCHVIIDKCIDCGKCQKVCPMQLPVNEILDKPDCIKCARCVEACPKRALSF